MESKTVMLVISAAVVLLIGFMVVVSVINSMPTLPTFTRSNASLEFAVNDTYYTPTDNGYNIAVTAMYNDSSHTCTYASTLYDYSVTQVKVLDNDTDDPTGDATRCPNMTSGNTYYFDYTYQLTASNTTWSNSITTTYNTFLLMTVILIVIAAGVILAYFGFGKFQQ